MSHNQALALSFAAAAATSILALHFLLYSRRAAKKHQLSSPDDPSSKVDQDSTERICCFPSVLRGPSFLRSRGPSAGTLVEPLLTDGRSEKQHAMQDETISNVPMSESEENAVQANCTLQSVAQARPAPHSANFSTGSDLTAQPQNEPERSGDIDVNENRNGECEDNAAAESSDAVGTDALSEHSPEPNEGQHTVATATPVGISPAQTAIRVQVDSAENASEQTVEDFLAESTGTLISYARPQPLQACKTSASAELSESLEDSSGQDSKPSGQNHSTKSTADATTQPPEVPATSALRRKLSSHGTLQTQAAPHQSLLDTAHEGQAAAGHAASSVPSNTLETSASSSQSSQAHHSSKSAPHLELVVTMGPSKGVSFATTNTKAKVHIGRLPQCQLTVNDNEVSGSHCVIVYSNSEQCWKLADVGSLNGTHLDGECVSRDNRRPGDLHALTGENTVKLGTVTQLQIKCASVPVTESVKPPSMPAILEGQRQHLFRNKIAFPPLRLEGCIVTKTGREHKRKAAPSEDLSYFEAPFRQFQNAGLFCVFDGHNGRQAAELAKQFVPDEILSNVNGSCSLLAEGSRQEALEAAFLAADARLAADEGCTATAVVAERGEDGTVLMQIANVGDSAAVLVNPSSSSPGVKLTEDHRVVNPVERERLKQKGFRGTTRLFGLALSRSMGDKFLKDVDVGLIAKPYVSQVVSIKPDEAGILVVASDGLWDVVTPERATKLVRMAMEESPNNVDYISERLLWFAVEHQSHDDITVMVLKFNPSDSAGAGSNGAS